MSSGPKRFVAIANTEYVGLPALPRAARDSRDLADAFEQQQHFEAIVLTDLGVGPLAEAVADVLAPRSLAGGTLILSWIGHGQIGADNTLRLMGRVGKADDEVASAGKLAEWAARTGASQVLVLVDTCFSAKGMAAAASMALAIDQGRVTAGRSWFCMVAASQAHEPALSGALSGRFLRLLTNGPRVPDSRWDRTRPFIRGDDVTNELLAQWDEPRQTPQRFTLGPADDLIDNLFHEPFVADQPLEHLLRAGRGSENEVSFFTGREDALARIVEWKSQARPGLFVVTGPPGCGKSAVAGRIVSLSSPAERERVLDADTVPATLDPGEASVDAQLQARAVTLEAAAEQIARQLGLDPKTGVYGVLAHAQAKRGAGESLFIVVDGLDEARALAPSIATKFLVPLAAEALVLVTTRDTLTDQGSLLDLLQPIAVRLDLAEARIAGQRDVHRYVLRRLEDVDARMDPAQVADEIAPLDDESMPTTFLLAWLVTSQLRDDPVATDDADWRRALAFTVESALEKDLQQPMITAAGNALDANVARTMLRALSLAYGNGLPADDVWPAVASAIAADGRPYTRDDAFAVLGALGRHVIASYEEKQPVYRIAHQRLIDHLLQPDPRAAAEPETPFESLLSPVADAIASLYRALLEAGTDPRAPVYLWRYAWRHLAAAGEFGIGLIRDLVAHDGEAFRPDLAAGLEFVSNEVWSLGDAARGLALREAAVDVRRAIGEPFRLVSALFDLTIWRAIIGEQALKNISSHVLTFIIS